MSVPQNREARRRALRELNRAAAKGRVEPGSESITAYCGWEHCGYPVALGVRDIQTASLAMQNHYNDRHGGKAPS